VRGHTRLDDQSPVGSAGFEQRVPGLDVAGDGHRPDATLAAAMAAPA
jgi:hypothetical protein